jgi:hypothetical protein
MKITYNDLKTAYKSHIQSHIPPSREGCPSGENLLSVFEKSVSPKKKEKIINHVVECAYCFREFEFLQSLIREENKAVEEIPALLRIRSRDRNRPKKKLKIGTIISASIVQRRPLWRLAAIPMVLLIITGLSLISIRSILSRKLDEGRGRLRDQVRLVSPIRGQAGTLPLVFRWEKVRAAESYQLEIFDGSLFPIWKSPPIIESSYKLPPNIAERIERNKVYFWMITALLPNGAKRESPLDRFILTKQWPEG